MKQSKLRSNIVIVAIASFIIFAAQTRLSARDVGEPLPDAFGDAMDTFGAGGPLLDIALFDLGYDQQDLYFTIDFFTPIAPASGEQPESLAGLLGLDVDQDLITGAPALQNSFSPPFAELTIGADYLLDFGIEEFNPGFVTLTTWDQAFVSLIPVTFDNMSVHGVIPLADLGGDDGLLNFAGVFGTFPQPTDATDRFGTSYAIPEPGATTILSVFAVMLLCRSKRASPIVGNNELDATRVR